MNKIKIILTSLILVAILGISFLYEEIQISSQNERPRLRHVDPSKESEQLPYSISFMLLISQIFDKLTLGNFKETSALLNLTNLAFVPSSYKFIFERFRQMLVKITNSLNDVDALLDKAEVAIDEGNEQNASLILNDASIELASANVTLGDLKASAQEITSKFALPSKEVYAKLNNLEALIDSMFQRLLELKHRLEKQRNLEETKIDLNVYPRTQWVGYGIVVEGNLHTENSSLPGRKITILVDGKDVARTTTDFNGYFNYYLVLPFVYKQKIFVQAYYSPEGEDKENYKPATSDPIEVNQLYIVPKIEIKVVGEALPGKYLNLVGAIKSDYYFYFSQVNISWITGSLTAPVNYDGSFKATLYIPETIADGNYTIVAKTPAIGIIAPSSNLTYVSIKRIPINASIYFPSLVIAGFQTVVKGKINYTTSENFNSTVTLMIEGKNYTTVIEGTDFNLTIVPSLTKFSGYEQYELSVSPSLPWYSKLKIKGEVLVINPVTLVIPVGLASVLTYALLKGEKKTHKKEIKKEGKEERKVVQENYSVPNELKWIVDLYWNIVSIVASITQVAIKPYMTLREYLSAVLPKLGKLSSSFETLTLTVEKVLYSPKVSSEELEKAKNAADEIKNEKDLR